MSKGLVKNEATQAEINRALYGSKYKNERYRGYHSKKEANVAAQLQALVRGGQAFDLREQVRYELIPKQKGQWRNEQAACYVADFCYKDKLGFEHVIDVKGVRTALYILKRKLLLHVHNIEIEEF
jgi:Protein of unknown function (DUF1064)